MAENTLFELNEKMPKCPTHRLYYQRDGECFYCLVEKADEQG